MSITQYNIKIIT